VRADASGSTEAVGDLFSANDAYVLSQGWFTRFLCSTLSAKRTDALSIFDCSWKLKYAITFAEDEDSPLVGSRSTVAFSVTSTLVEKNSHTNEYIFSYGLDDLQAGSLIRNPHAVCGMVLGNDIYAWEASGRGARVAELGTATEPYALRCAMVLNLEITKNRTK
jgi:hypothetical protein